MDTGALFTTFIAQNTCAPCLALVIGALWNKVCQSGIESVTEAYPRVIVVARACLAATSHKTSVQGGTTVALSFPL